MTVATGRRIARRRRVGGGEGGGEGREGEGRRSPCPGLLNNFFFIGEGLLDDALPPPNMTHRAHVHSLTPTGIYRDIPCQRWWCEGGCCTLVLVLGKDARPVSSFCRCFRRRRLLRSVLSMPAAVWWSVPPCNGSVLVVVVRSLSSSCRLLLPVAACCCPSTQTSKPSLLLLHAALVVFFSFSFGT